MKRVFRSAQGYCRILTIVAHNLLCCTLIDANIYTTVQHSRTRRHIYVASIAKFCILTNRVNHTTHGKHASHTDVSCASHVQILGPLVQVIRAMQLFARNGEATQMSVTSIARSRFFFCHADFVQASASLSLRLGAHCINRRDTSTHNSLIYVNVCIKPQPIRTHQLCVVYRDARKMLYTTACVAVGSYEHFLAELSRGDERDERMILLRAVGIHIWSDSLRNISMTPTHKEQSPVRTLFNQ